MGKVEKQQGKHIIHLEKQGKIEKSEEKLRQANECQEKQGKVEKSLEMYYSEENCQPFINFS